MSDASRRTVFVVALLTMVLFKTNPSFQQHRTALSKKSPVALTARSKPLAQMFQTLVASPEVGDQASPYYGPTLTRHDYKIFSMTSNGADGCRQSLGILGYVFDLRDKEYLMAQEQEAERMLHMEVADTMEEAAKPWVVSISDEAFDSELDYSSRGCEPGER